MMAGLGCKPHEGAHALGHRVGNVVEFEIEENRQAFGGHGLIALGAMGIEKFHADFQIADMGLQRPGKGPRPVKIRRIEGHADGVRFAHGALVSRK